MIGQSPVFERMFVGAAVRCALVLSAGAVRAVEDGASPLQPLVPCRSMGAAFEALTADRDNRYLMVDSTILRAHLQAANGKVGPRIRCWGAP